VGDAAEHGDLDVVDAYLRGLAEDAWETVNNLFTVIAPNGELGGGISE
jgi:hypothetical protein